MGDMSYIIEGYDSGVSKKALYSTVHHTEGFYQELKPQEEEDG